MKVIYVISVFAALGACSQSSVSSGSTRVQQEVLSEQRAGEQRVLVYETKTVDGTEVANYLVIPEKDFDMSSLTLTPMGDPFEYEAGAVSQRYETTVNGTDYTVNELKRDDGGTYATILGAPDGVIGKQFGGLGNIMEAGGPKVANIPVTGLYLYEGRAVLEKFNFMLSPFFGSVNFDNVSDGHAVGTVHVTDTGEGQVTVFVDLTDGSFADNDDSLTVAGNLHGDGASHMTGVMYTDDHSAVFEARRVLE